MRFDPKNPTLPEQRPLYFVEGPRRAVALRGLGGSWGCSRGEHLLTLRQLTSDLEGHPTPRLPFVDVATGSLGQGLGVGVGMALCARLDKLDYRTYVLMGDGEIAEGSVWEAASLAGINQLSNLVAIVDVNRLGQSEPTAFGHDMDVYRKRFEAFNWRTEVINGHDMEEILEVLGAAGLGKQPLAIIAKTKRAMAFRSWKTRKAGTARRSRRTKPPKPSPSCNPRPSPACRSRSRRRRQLPLPKNEAPAGYPRARL